MDVVGQKCLFSGIVVLLGQKWLYSGKSGCILAEVVVFEQSGGIRVKAVLFG